MTTYIMMKMKVFAVGYELQCVYIHMVGLIKTKQTNMCQQRINKVSTSIKMNQKKTFSARC